MLASRQQLGFAAPELNLPGDYSPRHVLGKGRNNVVYEATSRHAGEKFRFAVNVRPVPVGMPRIDTFGCLAVCTERMHSRMCMTNKQITTQWLKFVSDLA